MAKLSTVMMVKSSDGASDYFMNVSSSLILIINIKERLILVPQEKTQTEANSIARI